MRHYYRPLIILVIGLRCSTQAPCFTAPFMSPMTLLGFMCPGPGKLIRSQALSHCAINRPHDTSLFSHSLSPDQLPFLCTSFSFASYHMVYGVHAAMSALDISHFVLLPHAHACTLPHACTLHHAHTCTSPLPSLSYLFTPLALLSGCIQLDSALFHSFSPIITNTPITLCTSAHSLMSMPAPSLHSLALCAHT